MKITAIRATPVNIPLEAPYLWALGEHPGFSKTIIEVETDQGLVGLGEAMGRDLWFYSGDAGIMSAAYLHLSAALGHIREPAQSLFRWQVRDVLAEGPCQPKNNVVKAPEGPGLGVTLDRAALARAAAHCAEHGALSYYRDPGLGGAYRRLPVA